MALSLDLPSPSRGRDGQGGVSTAQSQGDPLSQCVSKHFAEFESVYPERYEELPFNPD